LFKIELLGLAANRLDQFGVNGCGDTIKIDQPDHTPHQKYLLCVELFRLVIHEEITRKVRFDCMGARIDRLDRIDRQVIRDEFGFQLIVDDEFHVRLAAQSVPVITGTAWYCFNGTKVFHLLLLQPRGQL